MLAGDVPQRRQCRLEIVAGDMAFEASQSFAQRLAQHCGVFPVEIAGADVVLGEEGCRPSGRGGRRPIRLSRFAGRCGDGLADGGDQAGQFGGGIPSGRFDLGGGVAVFMASSRRAASSRSG